MASTAVASATWLRRQGGAAARGARIHTWSSLVQVGTGHSWWIQLRHRAAEVAAESQAVPTSGCPAKGSSAAGVKIRSWPVSGSST